MSASPHVGAKTARGLAAVALVAMLAVPGAAAAAARSDCPAGICGAPAAPPLTLERAIRLADFDLEKRRREGLRRCCHKWKAGLPLKGFFCSPSLISEAIREYVCPPPYPQPYY